MSNCNFNRKKFAERLQKLRIEAQESTKVLSDFCGVSEATIKRYERGESINQISALAAIASHFDVSTDYLLGATNTKKFF